CWNVPREVICRRTATSGGGRGILVKDHGHYSPGHPSSSGYIAPG
ncbi:unnamed protein product, partial [Ectocarpus sp. 6 AP-2014]